MVFIRISAKGRYALAAAIEIARQSKAGEGFVPTASISKTLGISKIFLEQALASLKNGGVAVSAKGSSGGYRLAKEPHTISAWDILCNTESALIETAETTTESPTIEAALRQLVFDKLDSGIRAILSGISLDELLEFSQSNNDSQSFMLNI